MEPIRQVNDDGRKEDIVAYHLAKKYPDWRFYPTPRFYFSDFHLNHSWGNGRENYIGDLEVKWLKTGIEEGAIFPFEKLQKLMIAPPFTDSPDVFHRICFRFNDDTSVIPASYISHIIPRWNVRMDTQERDLVIDVPVQTLQFHSLGMVINQ